MSDSAWHREDVGTRDPAPRINPSEWESVDDIVAWADHEADIGSLYIAEDLRRVLGLDRHRLAPPSTRDPQPDEEYRQWQRDNEAPTVYSRTRDPEEPASDQPEQGLIVLRLGHAVKLTAEQAQETADLIDTLRAERDRLTGELEQAKGKAKRNDMLWRVAERHASRNGEWHHRAAEERDQARADRDRYEETLKKWLHLHSYRHTPEDIFALANETHAALHPTQAPTIPERENEA